jgi:GNAT superfamily N-acetyltransferase
MRSSDGSHDRLEQLIVADALGGLDEPDQQELARELADHGPDCQECRQLLADYAETAAGLALALTPVPMSAGAEDRLVEAARGEVRMERGTRPDEETPAGVGVVPGRRSRWVAAAAVAAALMVAAGVIGYALAPGRSIPTRTVSLAAGDRTLEVAYTPGDREALVIGTNIPDPPAGRVYQLWYQPREGSAMESAGTFVPDGGTVLAPATVGASFVAVAVSVEPVGGSRQPTTAPIYLTEV